MSEEERLKIELEASNITIGLQVEAYKKLQNNWNELKKWLEDYIKATEEDYKQTSTEGCKKTQETIIAVAKNLLSKMQEMED